MSSDRFLVFVRFEFGVDGTPFAWVREMKFDKILPMEVKRADVDFLCFMFVA